MFSANHRLRGLGPLLPSRRAMPFAAGRGGASSSHAPTIKEELRRTWTWANNAVLACAFAVVGLLTRAAATKRGGKPVVPNAEKAPAHFRRRCPPCDVEGASSPEDAVTATAEMWYGTEHPHRRLGEGAPCAVRVAPSTIPGAGLGLFARRAIPAGTTIQDVTYTGRVMSLSEVRKLPEVERDYVLCFHFNVHVDARNEFGSLGRYINDPYTEPGRRNAKFEKHVAERFAELRTTRAVEPGDEIFVDYGEGYWRAHNRRLDPVL